MSVKGVRSFLWHVCFDRRHIKDFSKHAHPLCKLLEIECKFYFNEFCLKTFCEFKEMLVFAPIVISSDWRKPFEVMCDASGVALYVILGQKGTNISPIYYSSKALIKAKKNYTMTEQEILVVVFAFEKFYSYLFVTMVIVHTNHST